MSTVIGLRIPSSTGHFILMHGGLSDFTSSFEKLGQKNTSYHQFMRKTIYYEVRVQIGGKSHTNGRTASYYQKKTKANKIVENVWGKIFFTGFIDDSPQVLFFRQLIWNCYVNLCPLK
jgi:hypothetical protein